MSLYSSYKASERSQWTKGFAAKPEFISWDPDSGNRDATPKICPLTPPLCATQLCSHLHVCTCIHTHTQTHK